MRFCVKVSKIYLCEKVYHCYIFEYDFKKNIIALLVYLLIY